MDNKLYKVPMLIGSMIAFMVFIIFYYSDYKTFTRDLDKLLYREYGIVAGINKTAKGNFSDSITEFTNKSSYFIPEEPPFSVLTLARSKNGFSLSEATMPNIRYGYRIKNMGSGSGKWREFAMTQSVRPTKVTDPAVVYKYAYLRTMLFQQGWYIKQSAYNSIASFPNYKSRFFDVTEVTSNQNLRNNITPYVLTQQLYFSYYNTSIPCYINFNNRFFMIGRNYTNVLCFGLGFTILGGIIGVIIRFLSNR